MPIPCIFPIFAIFPLPEMKNTTTYSERKYTIQKDSPIPNTSIKEKEKAAHIPNGKIGSFTPSTVR
jgi:hypothetical protein